MFLLVLVERAPKFKDLTKWCSRFGAKRIDDYIASFEDRGAAQALAFVAERHRARVVLFELDRGSLGLFLARCEDQRKLFGDLLPRALHRYGIYIPIPTLRGFPTIVFPSSQHLEVFKSIEMTVVKRYSEVIYIGLAEPVRYKDRETLNSIIRMNLRNKLFRDMMKKTGIVDQDLYRAFGIQTA